MCAKTKVVANFQDEDRGVIGVAEFGGIFDNRASSTGPTSVAEEAMTFRMLPLPVC